MRFEQLEQIIEIEKQKSISKAAQSLYMTQPTLSLSLSSLENEIGTPLFHRNSSGVTPTSVGEKVLQLSEQILEYRQQILDCGSREHAPTGKITVLITPAFSSLYSDIVTRFHQRYPDVIVDLQIRSFKEIIEELSTNRATIGITMWEVAPVQTIDVFEENNLHYEAFHTYPIMIYMAAGDPLLQSDKISDEQAMERQFAVFSDDYYKFGKMKFGKIQDSFLAVNPIFATDYHVMQHIIATSQAIASLPATFSIKNDYMLQEQIDARPFGDYTAKAYLLYSKSHPLTLLEECTISLLRELLQEYK